MQPSRHLNIERSVWWSLNEVMFQNLLPRPVTNLHAECFQLKEAQLLQIPSWVALNFHVDCAGLDFICGLPAPAANFWDCRCASTPGFFFKKWFHLLSYLSGFVCCSFFPLIHSLIKWFAQPLGHECRMWSQPPCLRNTRQLVQIISL